MKYNIRILRVKIKLLILYFFSYIPFILEYLGLPRKIYQKTDDYIIENDNNKKLKINYVKLNEGYYITRNILNKTISKQNIIPDTYFLGWKHKFDDQFVVEINNGKVRGDYGAILTADNFLLADLSRIIGLDQKFFKYNHPIYRSLNFRTPIQIKGNVVVLTSHGSAGIGHWILDALPRIMNIILGGFDLTEIDYFVVPKSKFKGIEESLKILGINKKKLISADNRTYIQASNLIIPSLVGPPACPPLKVVEFIRDKYLNSDKFSTIKHIDDSDTDNMIFISRKNANWRKLTNHNEVEFVLNELGFKSINLSDFSFVEQIALFNNAKVVIGPHGSGLSNIIFCNNNTKVIEFFSTNYINLCFCYLCDHLKLDYYYLRNHNEEEDNFYINNMKYVGEDMQVNIDELLELLHTKIFI